jgi:hypothetical protein
MKINLDKDEDSIIKIYEEYEARKLARRVKISLLFSSPVTKKWYQFWK